MPRRFARISCIGALSAALMCASAQAVSLEQRYEYLLRAVCLNDWESAVALLGPIIASPEINPTYRQNLVELRYQFQVFRDRGTVVPNIENCRAILQRYVAAADVPRQPLDWQAALNSVFEGRPGPVITAVERQDNARTPANLNRYEAPEVFALAPAQLMDMTTGSGVSAGSVGQGQVIYAFFGGLGDRVTLDVNVTRIRPGTRYTDDDTQLFLFDESGRLIAENDDYGDSAQSRLEGVLLPRTGRYYVAVTTYNNDPILNNENRIEGWGFSGGSFVDFTLTIRGVTPTNELIWVNYIP